jgi:hypothetical protein
MKKQTRNKKNDKKKVLRKGLGGLQKILSLTVYMCIKNFWPNLIVNNYDNKLKNYILVL